MLETTEVVAPETAAPETTATVEPQATEQPAEPAPQEEESAPSVEDSGDEPAEEAPPKKKGGGFQKRIDDLTRANYEKEYRIQQMEAELAKARKPAVDYTQAPGAEPKLEDYQTVEDFRQAVAEWGQHKGRFEAHQQIQQEQQQKEHFAAIARLEVREGSARQKYADYDQAVDQIAQIALQNPTLKEYYLESDAGPDVAYHLSKNPAKLHELMQMTPFAAMRELTKIEARLAAPPPPKAITQAPPPIKPVGARETVSRTLADLAASDDVAAYIARANKATRKT